MYAYLEEAQKYKDLGAFFWLYDLFRRRIVSLSPLIRAVETIAYGL
jgi:hypothetical protein